MRSGRLLAIAGLVLLCLASYAVVRVVTGRASGAPSHPATDTATGPVPSRASALPFVRHHEALPVPVGLPDDRRSQPIERDLLAAVECAGEPYNGFLTAETPSAVHAAMASYLLAAGDSTLGRIHVNLMQAQYGRENDVRRYVDGLRDACSGVDRGGTSFRCGTATALVPSKAGQAFTCEARRDGGDPRRHYEIYATSGRYLMQIFLSPPSSEGGFAAEPAALEGALAGWLASLYGHVDRYLSTCFGCR